jgi:hypothetical protein
MASRRPQRLVNFALLAWLLAACGGGGGDGSSNVSNGNSPPAGTGTNSPPTISGSPGTNVLADQSYRFEAIATDRDGDRLTFSSSNLPSWLSLDTNTGVITGRPTMADIGSYAGITVVVSDGRQAATLGPFSVMVAAAGNRSASLSWESPTHNTDGSPLANLSGYIVVYGQSPSELVQRISIPNASVNRFVVENLTSGTWYFAVQATNSNGVTSVLSGIAMATIS